MQMRHLLTYLLLVMLSTACFLEDEMVPPHEQGDVLEGSVAMGTLYGTQAYYDLHGNQVAASGPVTAWDLSFACAPDDWTIRLNSANFMYAGNSMDTSFQQEMSAEDLDMLFDASHGDPDSTAIGRWFDQTEDSTWSLRQVYLVDRGTDSEGMPRGLVKIQFETDGIDYRLRFANNGSSVETTYEIHRDPERDQIYFSFDEGQVDVAPLPGQWSILFSKYTTMLVTNEGENYPYIVNGVLLNPNGTAAALDTIHDFSEIAISDTAALNLTTRADVIGYDWKYYNFDAGVYTIVPGMNYVIRDRDGFYYKLRFVDFYNNTGEKGNPVFEYVRL
jgi:hypothetical protein